MKTIQILHANCSTAVSRLLSRIKQYPMLCLLVIFAALPSTGLQATNGTAVDRAQSAGKSTEENKRILFLGDSLTDGFGVSREESYPGLIQEKLDQAELPYTVVNAGVSGDTSAGGLRRIDWLLRAPVSVLVLALGANDGLRGLPPEKTKENLRGIIEKVRKKNPDVKILLAGMLVPPNMGADYESSFRKIFTSVAEEEGATLVPFLLEGVAAETEFNLEDGIHPNEEGHRIIAETVWKALYPLLNETIESDPNQHIASREEEKEEKRMVQRAIAGNFLRTLQALWH